jgi:Zn finger protein HypA/HybF involved in hydrogenase expression
MEYIQCPKCEQKNASVFQKKDLCEVFRPQAPGFAAISPSVLAAIIGAVAAMIKEAIREGMSMLRDLRQPYGVCRSCGHLWKIE